MLSDNINKGGYSFAHSAQDLPENITFFKEDNQSTTLSTFTKNIPTRHTLGNQLPVVCVLDKNGLIRYTSDGYKLGIGTDILNIYSEIE